MNQTNREQTAPEQIDRAAARRAFAAAAASYDQAAVLQREIATRLLEQLDYVRLQPQTVLDLGCGTGFALDDLARRYRRARLLALDFAEPMLARARRRGTWRNRPRLLCADLLALPLATASVDLVYSNATLQWASDLPTAFAELRRVLRPNGLLMFTSFGPDTLHELRAAWAAADGGRDAHVGTFIDLHDVGDALVRAGFADPVMDAERITLTYRSTRALMADLKALGAHNVLAGRPRGLTGRHRLAAVEAAYEAQRRDGRLPATWEVVYGHAWAPAASARAPQQRTADGVLIPVGAIGRRAGGRR